MTIPSTKVPTAREAAIAAIEEAMLGTLPVPFGVLSEKVETLIDAVTAAIEARDATLRSAVEAETREECARLVDCPRYCGQNDCAWCIAAKWIRALATGEKR